MQYLKLQFIKLYRKFFKSKSDKHFLTKTYNRFFKKQKVKPYFPSIYNYNSEVAANFHEEKPTELSLAETLLLYEVLANHGSNYTTISTQPDSTPTFDGGQGGTFGGAGSSDSWDSDDPSSAASSDTFDSSNSGSSFDSSDSSGSGSDFGGGGSSDF